MAFPWMGAQAVCESVAHLGPKHGAFISSRKRPWWHILSRQNPGSDHNEANKNAYALDFGTFNGGALAHALARALGIRNYSTGNFNIYAVRIQGAVFHIQILWGVAGHFNHVHLGVRYISGTFRGFGPTMEQKVKRMRVWMPGRDIKNDKGWIRNDVLKDFQKLHGLEADGEFGPNTWKALKKKRILDRDEQMWVNEYRLLDRKKHKKRAKALREQMQRRRTHIKKAAGRTGWDKFNRRERYKRLGKYV